MAERPRETAGKRPREEEEQSLEEEGDGKRYQRSAYHHDLLSLLLDEPPDDGGAAEEADGLSSIMSTFQQELSPASESDPAPTESGHEGPGHDRVEDGEVLRHLLEASDDELGIPTRPDEEKVSAEFDGDGDGDGLWEMEDESANYYSLLHWELFM